MKHWAAYDATTGEIKIVFTGSEPTSGELNGCVYIEGKADPSTQYIESGLIVDRPEYNLTMTSTEFTVEESILITGIPPGTVVHFEGSSQQVDDGELDWGVSVPGVYILRFEQFPYLPLEVAVDVSEA